MPAAAPGLPDIKAGESAGNKLAFGRLTSFLGPCLESTFVNVTVKPPLTPGFRLKALTEKEKK